MGRGELMNTRYLHCLDGSKHKLFFQSHLTQAEFAQFTDLGCRFDKKGFQQHFLTDKLAYYHLWKNILHQRVYLRMLAAVNQNKIGQMQMLL